MSHNDERGAFGDSYGPTETFYNGEKCNPSPIEKDFRWA